MKSSFSWPAKTSSIAIGPKEKNSQRKLTTQTEFSSVTGRRCTAFHEKSLPSTTSLALPKSTLSHSFSTSAAASTPMVKNSKKMSRQSVRSRLKLAFQQTSSLRSNGSGAEMMLTR